MSYYILLTGDADDIDYTQDTLLPRWKRKHKRK